MNNYIKNILKNANTFKTKSIFVQNFILCVALIILPVIAMNISFYLLYSNSLDNEFNNNNTSSLTASVNVVDSMFSTINSSIMGVINNTDVLQFIQSEYTDPTQKLVTRIITLLGALPTSNDNVYSAYLYSNVNNCILSETGKYKLDNFYDPSISNLISTTQLTETVTVRRTITLYNQNPVDVITIITPIYPYFYSSGYIIINIDIQEIDQKTKFLKIDADKSSFSILSRDDRILYSSKSNLSEDNQDKMVTYNQKSNISSYKYRMVVSNADYTKGKLKVFFLLMLFAFFSLLLTIGFSLIITLKTSRPIGNILDILEEPEKWVDDQQITSATGDNEIKLIISSMLNSFNLSQNVPEQTAIRTALLKKAQTIALQAQINPHFLFNTLEIINLSANELTDGENETTELISALSDLLRLSFKTKDILITIEDEIAFVEKYLFIQLIRYDGMFKVKYDIDPKVSQNKIVKLSLQPFVENAIYHGVKPSGKECIIKIKVYEKNKNIIIEIQDDGVGMSKERQIEINKKLDDNTLPEDESIGITNVHRRIRLTFGEPYGVRIASNKNPTSFIITIPKTL